VSDRCKDLVSRLIQDKEQRLSCRLYQHKDRAALEHQHESTSSSSSSGGRGRQAGGGNHFGGQYVFPNDGEDIKSHRWFRNIPWDRLHTMSPPFVPQLSSAEDMHYFDEEEPISDWSGGEDEAAVFGGGGPQHGPSKMDGPAEVRQQMPWARSTVVSVTAGLMQSLVDPGKLRTLYGLVDADLRLTNEEKHMVKEYLRMRAPPRERKRARDKLLRDVNTRAVVMDVRMKTAFLGYTWRRMRRSPVGAY